MARLRLVLALGIVTLACGTSVAFAQHTAPRPQHAAARPQRAAPRLPRGFVAFNVGAQTSSSPFEEPIASSLYLETAVITPTYNLPAGLSFDGSAGIRLVGWIGAGVTISSVSLDDDAEITASIPHPLLYRQPRTVNGADSGTRREVGTHLQALVFVPLPMHTRVVLSGGPSWFSARQDIVTGITFSETYPYDSATLASASHTSVSTTATGFNVGADVQWPLAKYVGIGVNVRYAHARVDLPVTNATEHVRSDVGGLQAGGGVRFSF
jgi:hypothetical protein